MHAYAYRRRVAPEACAWHCQVQRVSAWRWHVRFAQQVLRRQVPAAAPRWQALFATAAAVPLEMQTRYAAAAVHRQCHERSRDRLWGYQVRRSTEAAWSFHNRMAPPGPSSNQREYQTRRRPMRQSRRHRRDQPARFQSAGARRNTTQSEGTATCHTRGKRALRRLHTHTSTRNRTFNGTDQGIDVKLRSRLPKHLYGALRAVGGRTKYREMLLL